MTTHQPQQDAEKLHVIIVDDEPHVRRRILLLLQDTRAIDVIGECANGVEAVTSIAELRPDIVFLDIQMPGLDGFDVLRSLPPELIPVIVFVTAFDRYAIKAFEVNAVDYVLKPIDRERFGVAVGRAIDRAKQQRKDRSPESNRVRQFLHDYQQPCQRLLVKVRGSHHVLNVPEINWIEAADKYVRLHTDSESFLCRQTMNEMETKLVQSGFVRIHRSTLVNLRSIKEVKPNLHGDYKIVLNGGAVLALSRSYKPGFDSQFEVGL